MFLQTRLYYTMKALMRLKLCYRDRGEGDCTKHLMHGVNAAADLSEQFLSFLHNTDRVDLTPVTAITAYVYDKFKEAAELIQVEGDQPKAIDLIWGALSEWDGVGIPCFQVLGYAEPERFKPSTLYVPGQGYIHWLFPFTAFEVPNGGIGLFSDNDEVAYMEAATKLYPDVEKIPYALLEKHRGDTQLDALCSAYPEVEVETRRDKRAIMLCGLWKQNIREMT